MKNGDKNLTELRRQAEERVRARHRDSLTVPPEELHTLVHELEIHQVELLMQNDELQRSHLELEQSRDNFSNLFEFAPVGYLILDVSGRIGRANLTSAELLGIDRAQLHETHFFHLLPKEHRDSLFRHLRQVFRYEMRQRCEVEVLRGDGSRFYARLDSILQPEIEGDILHCLTLVSDITELKRAETISRKARETAEKASQAKSSVLTAASHDLRQPLQAMTTISDILKSKLKDEEDLALVGNLSECLISMKELFNTLLNVSQLESGSITPRIVEFPVEKLLHRIGTTCHLLARKKGLRLRVAKSSAIIRSDPVLLGQILDNLVSNAIRYTENGTILLGCRHCGSLLRIEVWDTGIGIPEEKRGTVFDDFCQLGNPERDPNRGLGLGLAIAARTARLLGTQVELRSWERGSLFSVETPMAAIASSHEQALDRFTEEENSALDGSLLLVEDNRAVLRSLTRLLEIYGYNVTEVTSGPEALTVIRERKDPFDLIITDYRLPKGETGIDLIRRVRQALEVDMPALVITGEVFQVQAVESSGLRILQKPVTADLLNKHIQEMLA